MEVKWDLDLDVTCVEGPEILELLPAGVECIWVLLCVLLEKQIWFLWDVIEFDWCVTAVFQAPHQPGQPGFKFTVAESCDRIKDEFQFLQAQYHR